MGDEEMKTETQTAGRSKEFIRSKQRDENKQLPTSIFVEAKEEIQGLVKMIFPPRIPREEGSETEMGPETAQRDMGGKMVPTEDKDYLGYENSKEIFSQILNTFWEHVGSFTVINERYHVDPVYRDSYYNYFAGQHFDVSRFTRRLTFFSGNWADEDAFSSENAKKLNDSFLGACVVYPTEAQTLGRVLIRPNYILGTSHRVRLTEYSITVRGIRLTLRAFPFQMQDRETTRCAEVTLLNILDYFGNTYSDYRVYLPGEIVNMEKQFTSDRTLPSRGITYAIMSKLLTRCGFSPRLYSVKVLRKGPEEKINPDWQSQEIHRLLHYYIESGIPVAVNVAKGKVPGHSLICIGYKDEQDIQLDGEQIADGLILYNSADFYHKYVVIDDNQMPYTVRDFERLSRHAGYKVVNILVPLYKRMHLEAADAYDVARFILKDKYFGIASRAPEILERGEALVLRLFLASSRTFKAFRMEHSNEQEGKYCKKYRELYREIPLPRFVWVAELFVKSDYEASQGKAFGEIVLDATSSTKNDVKSIIMLNYPKSVSARWPNSTIRALNRGYENFTLSPFSRFTGNLEELD